MEAGHEGPGSGGEEVAGGARPIHRGSFGVTQEKNNKIIESIQKYESRFDYSIYIY